ncbi:MAG: 6-phosphofructokinase [Bacillota bacterium]|jgi:6-phosphofructokinase 1
MSKKIAVLTGGGDCPGLNAVIRAVVKTAIGKHGWEVFGFQDGYYGLVMNQYRPLNSNSVSGLIERGGTILGSSNRDNPFHFKTTVNDIVTYRDLSDQAMRNLEQLGVDYLIAIGGDGTLSSARDFAAKGLKVVGVPKTIDNDLNATDLTFGFMTAVETATEALDRLHTTAESHHRIMVLEVMGRNAGWIALYSGIAGGADVILIPEIPFDIPKIVRKIEERRQNGKNFSIIVVAEGAYPLDGEAVVAKIVSDSPDPVRLGGIGPRIADQLEQLTGLEARHTILGHLQRGGRPTPYDRILATRYGVGAVELVAADRSGVMVSLQGTQIAAVSLQDALGRLKTINPVGEMVRVAQSIGIEFGG